MELGIDLKSPKKITFLPFIYLEGYHIEWVCCVQKTKCCELMYLILL